MYQCSPVLPPHLKVSHCPLGAWSPVRRGNLCNVQLPGTVLETSVTAKAVVTSTFILLPAYLIYFIRSCQEHGGQPTKYVTWYLDLVWRKFGRRTLASGKTFADNFLNNGRIFIKQRRRPSEKQTTPSVGMRMLRKSLNFELEVPAFVAPSRILRSGVDDLYRKWPNWL